MLDGFLCQWAQVMLMYHCDTTLPVWNTDAADFNGTMATVHDGKKTKQKNKAADKEAVKCLWHLPNLSLQLGLWAFF